MALDKLFAGLSDAGSDPRSLLGNLLGSSGSQGALGGAASGAVVSLLMNKKARKMLSRNAGKVGGAAALAGVGYLAYRQWQQGSQPRTALLEESATPPPLPADLEAASVEVNVSVELPMKMVLAMIAAAAADGTIDGIEMNALVTAIEHAPIEPAEKSRLTAALNEPPTVEAVAALATNKEEASELYGAALTTIEIDTPAEDFFMRRLARSLNLEPQLVETLHRTLEGDERGQS